MRRLLLWGPPLVYMALIYQGSSQSDPLPQITHLVWDKALHFAEYSVLGLLLFRALRGEELPFWPAIVLAALLTSTYGASDEWHQAFVPHRTSDAADWLADTIGGGIGASVYGLARNGMKPRRSGH